MAMEVCHVWVGVFADDAPEDYFTERYGDDDPPVNRFAQEQGEWFYDHDWVEISLLPPSDAVDPRTLALRHSYGERYADAVAARAADLGLERVNLFVLADRDEFDAPRSVEGPGYRLVYLGTFDGAE